VAQTFQCSIITPQETAFEGEITYATFQAWDGQEGLLSQRSPLLTKLGIGIVRLDLEAGGKAWFLLDGGFAQMQEGVLMLLSGNAMSSDSVSLSEAQSELDDANARVVTGTEDRDQRERTQQWARAKVDFAKAAG